ncbi:MAG: hypothetical protein ACKV2V_27635 [Blastocatellia bacterium]
MFLGQLIVWILLAWAGIGFLFALWFALAGVTRLDAAAAGTGAGFRLLLLPGAIALWPLLAWRLARGAHEPPTEHNAHRAAAQEPRP